MADAYGSHPRKEDARLIRGQGTFIDDISLPGMLHAAILRSPLAHATLVDVDVTAALAHPKVTAVLTGADLAARDLAWMPTLSGDAQAVLATDKVRFQGQEVAFVVATDRYAARDALELITVDYEPLEPVLDPGAAASPPVFTWTAGDRAATEAAFAGADVVVAADLSYPRVHPAPLETCGAVADYDAVSGKLTLWCTTQAPHAHRTIYSALTGLPEHKIRVISPDLGGGFGSKVPIYPGYICAIVASMVTGRPVKWVEDRSENLMSTAFARDFRMRGEIAASADGKILAVRAHVLADHGAFNAVAQPTKFPAGFFSLFSGSYDMAAAFCEVTGVLTNKAPGGVAYSCSFRVAEAVYLVERLVELLARRLGADPAELRMANLLRPEQFPYRSPTGWEYDSGDYPRALALALELAGYEGLRQEQAERRARGEYMGIGLSFFTEGVGAGPRKHMDILGLGMADGADLRVHPSGKAVLGISVQTQGQGHETTFAQLVAAELGLSAEDVEVVHGDTDRTPFGLGTYGSRSTPVSGAAAVVAARRVRERARLVAAAMLEASADDLEWLDGAWRVRGDYDSAAGIAEIARAAHSSLDLPPGVDGHLDASAVYNPPNLTFPFGAYICVTDVDPGTGEVKVRRFIAVDDCGVRINPRIVEGQVHRGLADGIGIALMQAIVFDSAGNCLSGSFMDYLLPTSLEVPSPELGATVTPSPHHPVGAKGVGESATVGSPAAVVNSVMDALAPFGVTHADMPLTPAAVWTAIQAAGSGSGLCCLLSRGAGWKDTAMEEFGGDRVEDVVEQGEDRPPGWLTSLLAGHSRWPGWRPSRGAAILAAIALVTGLAAGYGVGRSAGQPQAVKRAASGTASASPRGSVFGAPVPYNPLNVRRVQGPSGSASAPVILNQVPSIDSQVLTQAVGACSAQVGRELQLGVQVDNLSGEPVTLRRVEADLPLGGLKMISEQWEPCGGLPTGYYGGGGDIVGPSSTSWFSVTFEVLVKCPLPYPVQFKVEYDVNGRTSTASLPGFPDLTGVSYTGCPAQ